MGLHCRASPKKKMLCEFCSLKAVHIHLNTTSSSGMINDSIPLLRQFKLLFTP